LSVDVGEVEIKEMNQEGKVERKRLEVDFVCNQGYKRYYIQSAFTISDDEKRETELRSLNRIGDSFRKIVIVGGSSPHYQNNDGIIFMSLYDFLINPNSLLE
jgi:hypothetical protein